MVRKYSNLTVVELKKKLKTKSLPVSGTKSVLIKRLEDHDVMENSKKNTTVSEKKVIFKCGQCSTKLKIPKSYNGKIKCPMCSFEQEVNGEEIKGVTFFEDLDISNIFDFLKSGAYIIYHKIKSLDSKNVSLAFSITAAVLIIISIFTFFSAFSYEAMCQEENRGTVMIDGEVYQSCDGGSWPETDSARYLFNACCILVPISIILAILGIGIRKEADLNLTTNQEGNKFTVVTNVKSKSSYIDKTTKTLQISILGFSVSLGVIVIIIGILLLLFIIFVFSIILGAWEAAPPFQP